MRRSWWLISAAAVLAMAAIASRAPAQPGTLLTRDGHTILGDITETQDAVIVVLHGIASRYDRSDVAQVIYNGTVDDQFRTRLKVLGPFDLRGRIDLAGWASQQQRPDLAIVALQQARDIEPTNREAALDLQAAQRQVDLDELRHPPSTAPAGVIGVRPTRVATSASVATSAPVLPPPSYRLLSDDEVNRLRQKELGGDESGIVFEFRNDVVRRYLSDSGENPKRFRAQSLAQQASEILADGNPDDADDVRVVTDPPSLRTFRQHLMPVIATACGSTACHGGGVEIGTPLHGGSFQLFTGDAPNTVYTNFYILQNYTTTVDGVEYHMIDRTLPARSLLLQFALPADQTETRHPPVPQFRPRFRSRTDPVFQRMQAWITSALAPIQPDYGIRVLCQPTTVPTRVSGE